MADTPEEKIAKILAAQKELEGIVGAIKKDPRYTKVVAELSGSTSMFSGWPTFTSKSVKPLSSTPPLTPVPISDTAPIGYTTAVYQAKARELYNIIVDEVTTDNKNTLLSILEEAEKRREKQIKEKRRTHNETYSKYVAYLKAVVKYLPQLSNDEVLDAIRQLETKASTSWTNTGLVAFGPDFINIANTLIGLIQGEGGPVVGGPVSGSGNGGASEIGGGSTSGVGYTGNEPAVYTSNATNMSSAMGPPSVNRQTNTVAASETGGGSSAINAAASNNLDDSEFNPFSDKALPEAKKGGRRTRRRNRKSSKRTTRRHLTS